MLIKFKKTKSINIDNWISIIFLCLICIGGILNIIANKTYTEDNFTIGEWLINYQGGFVRRGFWGEIIYFFSSSLKITPIYLIWFICILSYIFLMRESFKLASGKVSNTFLLSPAIFLAPIVGDFLVRKDIFLLLLFLVNLKILKQKNPNFILFQIINLLGILIHETFAIYSFPIQIFLLWNKVKSKRKNIILISNFFVPSVVFLL